ncbi:MAG TPA: hypothetical protein VNV88_09060 [Candidatus Solibacter sp.]|nr:hypothetical protein [Candidatus Solibacter sp.]
MDKATLVKRDIDIGGRVMSALSRAKIPVTLYDWNYFPQLDEWQLIIATPWYDSKGPHEAATRVFSALQQEGIYADAPIRRLSVKSPDDPLVKGLERELKAQTEGTIHIVDYTESDDDNVYSVVFSPYTGRGGAMPSRRISGVEHLRGFLENRLHIARSSVEEALRELDHKHSASIPNVLLTKREAKSLGLA